MSPFTSGKTWAQIVSQGHPRNRVVLSDSTKAPVGQTHDGSSTGVASAKPAWETVIDAASANGSVYKCAGSCADDALLPLDKFLSPCFPYRLSSRCNKCIPDYRVGQAGPAGKLALGQGKEQIEEFERMRGDFHQLIHDLLFQPDEQFPDTDTKVCDDAATNNISGLDIVHIDDKVDESMKDIDSTFPSPPTTDTSPSSEENNYNLAVLDEGDAQDKTIPETMIPPQNTSSSLLSMSMYQDLQTSVPQMVSHVVEREMAASKGKMTVLKGNITTMTAKMNDLTAKIEALEIQAEESKQREAEAARSLEWMDWEFPSHIDQLAQNSYYHGEREKMRVQYRISKFEEENNDLRQANRDLKQGHSKTSRMAHRLERLIAGGTVRDESNMGIRRVRR